MNPVRIQRKRTKGWKMPENTIYVGRPSKWGNPFKTGDVIHGVVFDLQKVILAYYCYIQYRTHKLASKELKLDLSELKGKNLACWCPVDKPCHADILLELANIEEEEPMFYDRFMIDHSHLLKPVDTTITF